MVAKGKSLILFIVAYLASCAVQALCVNNPYHMTQAAQVFTYKECLTCHAEGMKKGVSICLGENCLYSKDHSLMHRYPPVGKEKDFAPIHEVERLGAIFEDGKITCLSCHDLSKPPPHLIRERERDQICLVCHISFIPK